MNSHYKQLINKHGIAVHTLVLVIMMGLFALVALFLFYKWATPSAVEATAASCAFKKIAYCTDWSANDYGKTPWDWNKKPPFGCEDFGIEKPTSAEDCKIE